MKFFQDSVQSSCSEFWYACHRLHAGIELGGCFREVLKETNVYSYLWLISTVDYVTECVLNGESPKITWHLLTSYSERKNGLVPRSDQCFR